MIDFSGISNVSFNIFSCQLHVNTIRYCWSSGLVLALLIAELKCIFWIFARPNADYFNAQCTSAIQQYTI